MLKVFNGHIINIDNMIEIKWHAETSELVYKGVDGDWCGIVGTEEDFKKFRAELAALGK